MYAVQATLSNQHSIKEEYVNNLFGIASLNKVELRLVYLIPDKGENCTSKFKFTDEMNYEHKVYIMSVK